MKRTGPAIAGLFSSPKRKITMPKILVSGPEGTSSVNVGGEQFNANDKGLFEVEEGVLVLLEPHGFKRYVESAAAADNAGATDGDTAAATGKAAAKAAAKAAVADNAGA